METKHYSAAELADLVRRAATGNGPGEHVDVCDQCHMLLALVRRAGGEPSDEEAEVTAEALSMTFRK